MKCVERIKTGRGWFSPEAAQTRLLRATCPQMADRRSASGEIAHAGRAESVGINLDAQAIVAPVLNIIIEDPPVLIVVESTQQQGRTPFHYA